MKFNDFLDGLANYEPGKDIEVIAREFGLSRVIKLASNENPLGTSEKVAEILRQSSNLAHLYPDDTMSELKGKLAKHYGVGLSNIIIGAGSDQIIEYAAHSKLNAANAFIQAGVTFAMYQIYARQTRSKCLKTASITHNLSELKSLYAAHKNEVKIVFLCVPNNPLGECLSREEVYEFLRFVDSDCLVVIDGAYNEFAAFKDEKMALNPADLVSKFKNALYLGTFSKLYALGGLRVGYGIADSAIIQAFYKLRAPFNVANLSLKAAAAALDDKKFTQKTLENNFSQMKLYEDFARKHGIKFINSYTNFITYFFGDFDENSSVNLALNSSENVGGNLGENSAEFSGNSSRKRLMSSDLANALLKKGVIIRDLKSYSLNAIRITIGTPEQNEVFFREFGSLL